MLRVAILIKKNCSAYSVLLILCLVVLMLAWSFVRAQVGPCVGQGHLATEAEARSAPTGGIVAGQTIICDTDAALGINAEVGNAQMYLQNLLRTGSDAQAINIERLNSAFAICAKNFFVEYQSRYGPVTITSAYRSPAMEVQLCVDNPSCGRLMNNPNPNGSHQMGLAMDVKASTQSTMIEFARQNPQFGVCFPFTGEGGGFQDPIHMILAGIPSAETRGPGCRGVTAACKAGNYNPNSITSPFPEWATAMGFSPPGGATSYNSNASSLSAYPFSEAQAYSAVGNNTTGGNPFANPYNPTQQNQMCVVSTTPLYLMPCGQQPQFMPQAPFAPPPMLPPPPPPPPPPPMQPPPISNTTPAISNATPGNTSGSNTNTPTPSFSQPTSPSPSPIYATTIPTPPSAIIIAQSTRILRRESTLISWASVGTAPDSCTITQNGIQFSTGNQGSQLLPAVMTGTVGTITFVLDCTDFAGAHSSNSVSVVVQ